MNKEDFIQIWNKSKSVHEVSTRTGYAYYSATSKASRLRSEGYELKKFIPSSEYFQKIGRIGGKIGRTGGFYANRKLASEAGRKGGLVSKRRVK